MPEFTQKQCQEWLALSMEKDVSISSAIYYSLYFEIARDQDKYIRAIYYFKKIHGISESKKLDEK